MNKEGELKKRIRDKMLSMGNYEGTDASPRDIFKILDEANKEYPSLTSLGLVPKMDVYDLDRLLIARNNWFKKWHGVEKK